MTVETKLALSAQEVRSFSEQNDEPAAFADFRVSALEKAAALELPKPDRTNITKWNFIDFPAHTVESAAYTSLEELPEEAKAIIDTEGQENLYIQRNNTPAYIKVSNELVNKGVIFTDIQTAIREHADLVEKYYMTTAVKVDENKLTAYHAALVNGGIFVYVPRNVVIETPLQVVFINDNAEASLFNHVLVVAEESSAVTYVETYISTFEEAKGQVNVVTEVIAKNNAQVTFGAVDNLAKGFTSYMSRRGHVERDAKIDWALGLMNDGNTVYENTTNLIGDNSTSDFKMVTVGRGEQKLNFTTLIRQWGKNSDGRILKHGVMKDAAQSIFNGIGHIMHGATKANAEQESRVLMLSEKARGDANPILLIDEDDVTAGHAASVGRVDPTQLYYLMSRGISKTEAERLVIHGFLAPVVTNLPIEGVKKQLTEVIERKVR
ncbi:Fe-S cluster assembly protein SufD [Lysinibacillus sp. 2017]|uniref:Fe-S cluster assembly protein SufD n=1 Tax=unclassified Lysinibacillus TaxID=2636778 RepID=UPI000D527B92|nr:MULTISPECIES: Fe-S cluster assembly protein SufD [unclassified Lysinibacillus]AWE08459.1 Fe-S cluster assembly protein SufD [Lysinibacillus sp. 2017]TGN34947.1 Fe-S cluster assembly protein SufD [Lysinibacillus sp. S2017]